MNKGNTLDGFICITMFYLSISGQFFLYFDLTFEY